MSVRIVTLGQVRVRADGRDRPALPQQRLRCAFLVYVALEGDCSRESLLSTFWPDKSGSAARHILSQTLYEVRQALGEDTVVTEGDRVRVGPRVSIDARDFERAVETGDGEAAIALYGGPFLAGFSLPNNNGFEIWVDRRRASLERLHRRARRERILGLEAGGDLAAAVAAARAWADVAPLEDEAQHKLFELLLRTGDRVVARARFEEYQRLLRAELDVAPLDDTVALFEREWPPVPAAPAGPSGIAATAPAGAASSAPRTTPVAAQPESRARRLLAPAFGLPRVHQGVAAAGLALLALVSVLTITNRGGEDVSVIDLPGVTGALDPSRIAVLYFEDNSQDGSLRPIANGLTDALIAELSDVDQLSVISRHGVRRFADGMLSSDSIGRALSVGTIVRGSLQRSGDVLRVHVQMIDATSGVVTPVMIQKPEGELFALQDEIARNVATFLRERLGHSIQGRLRQREARSEDAWRAVQEALEQAEEIWAAEKAVPEELVPGSWFRLRSADRRLALAEQLDPEWIEPTILRGWVALGEARLAGSADAAAYDAALERGLRYAEQVLDRQRRDPRALELRGTLRYHRARSNSTRAGAAAERAAAASDLQAAFEADRSLVGAASTLSRLRQYDGDLDAARLFAVSALEEDAYLREGPDLRQRLYRIHLDLENVEAAMDSCLEGRAGYPADYRFVECQLAIPALTGRPIAIDSAQALMDQLRDIDPPGRDAMYRFTYREVLFARVLYQAGLQREAIAKMDAIRAHVEPHPTLARPFDLDDAAFLLMAGDTAGALDRLARYVHHNPEQRAYLSRFFLLKSLRSDPRFRRLMTDSAR